MSITHITFDCYGTLIDWRRGIEDHLAGLLQKAGRHSAVPVFPLYLKLEAEEERRYRPYRIVLRDVALRLTGELGAKVSEREADEFAASVALWPPFGDTVKTLRELGRRGYRRMILSNVDRDLLEQTIAKNRLEVDGYITAEDVNSYKPAPGHWLGFLRAYGVRKEHVLHVAQSWYHDIRPAAQLGFRTAWINRYGEPPLSEAQPDYALPDLRNLLTILT